MILSNALGKWSLGMIAHHEVPIGRMATRESMRWYGWGSPVGLGLFVLLLAGAAALLLFALR